MQPVSTEGVRTACAGQRGTRRTRHTCRPLRMLSPCEKMVTRQSKRSAHPLTGSINDFGVSNTQSSWVNIFAPYVPGMGRHGSPLGSNGTADSHTRNHLDIIGHLHAQV